MLTECQRMRGGATLLPQQGRGPRREGQQGGEGPSRRGGRDLREAGRRSKEEEEEEEEEGGGGRRRGPGPVVRRYASPALRLPKPQREATQNKASQNLEGPTFPGGRTPGPGAGR